MPEPVVPVVPAATPTPSLPPTETAPPATDTSTSPAAPAAAPEKPTEPQHDHMAERFAQLAKQTRAIALEKQRLAADRQAQEQAHKAREEALSAKIAKIEEFEKSQGAALSDPGQLMRRLYGENWYDRLTQYKLEGEKAPPPELAVQAVRDEAKAEIERVRKENEERWAKAEEQRKQAAEAARAQAEAEQKAVYDNFCRDTIDFVTSNPEKYELLNLTENQALVVQVIEQTFKKTQRLLTREEAADAAEKHLEEQAARVFAGKKWAARQASQKPTEEPTSESARTLTNGQATGAGGQVGPGSAMDRYARAAAAMEAEERRLRANQ